jgi:hypothetical protein
MKILVALILSCLSALPAMADVTKADVKKLMDAKVSDAVIVEYVKTNAPVRMTAGDLASLKNAGVSDDVLAVLAQYMGVPSAPTETVYIYRPYYNSWYWSGWCWHYYYRPVYYRPLVVRRPVVVRPAPVRPHGGHR